MGWGESSTAHCLHVLPSPLYYLQPLYCPPGSGGGGGGFGTEGSGAGGGGVGGSGGVSSAGGGAASFEAFSICRQTFAISCAAILHTPVKYDAQEDTDVAMTLMTLLASS